jgi:hypothetical protein
MNTVGYFEIQSSNPLRELAFSAYIRLITPERTT